MSIRVYNLDLVAATHLFPGSGGSRFPQAVDSSSCRTRLPMKHTSRCRRIQIANCSPTYSFALQPPLVLDSVVASLPEVGVHQ